MKLRLALLILSVLVFCSCGQLHKEINELFAGEQTRESLFYERLERYHRSLAWTRVDEAGLYISPRARAGLFQEMAQRGRGQRITEVQVEKVDFGPEKETAEVTAVVKYFAKPAYVVKSRRESESWRYYGSTSGWLIYDLKIVSEG